MEKKNITIGLSINGSELEEYPFDIDEELADTLERLYREESAKPDFDNDKFWQTLETQHTDVADSIRNAIEESFAEYIFTDDWIFAYKYSDGQEARFVDPNCLFPLADLHFDYLTAEGKPTLRHFYCEKYVIYDDNKFDCDFSESFDS